MDRDLAEGTKHAFGKVILRTLIVKRLERCQICLAPLTDDHCVAKGELFALQRVLLDHLSLALDAILELSQKLTHSLVVKVYLLLDPLYVHRLQEVALFSLLFIPSLPLRYLHLAILIHIGHFKSLTILKHVPVFLTQKEVLFINDVLFGEGLEHFAIVVEFILLLKSG